jgi:hypothetical protein
MNIPLHNQSQDKQYCIVPHLCILHYNYYTLNVIAQTIVTKSVLTRQKFR